ncbi:hypothetical protein [Laceyella putida]|uniref:ATP-binding protein n=1 Tax=Laceyella putida TaxID=110101 RepID=A0ABW2RQJ3_9BACL
MQIKYVKSKTFKLVPYVPIVQKGSKQEVTEEKNQVKNIVKLIGNMNKEYDPEGQVNDDVYVESPHLSFKVFKHGGKIHQYISIPAKLEMPASEDMQKDIGSHKLIEDVLKLPDGKPHIFALAGYHHLAMESQRETPLMLEPIFQLIKKDETFLYSVTAKEAANHDETKKALRDRFYGIDTWWKKTRQVVKKQWAKAYDMVESDRTKEVMDVVEGTFILGSQLYDSISGLWVKKEEFDPAQYPQTEAKLKEVLDTKFHYVEVLFFIWTEDPDKVTMIKNKIMKQAEKIKGENEIKLIEIQPDMERVAKGHLSPETSRLCLTRREMDKLFPIKKTSEITKDYFHEVEQKSPPPPIMYNCYELGVVTMGTDLSNDQILAYPKADNEDYLDDRGMPTFISGKKGSGKTKLLIKQVADTFCTNYQDLERWKKESRSAFVIDVIDGEMITEIYNLVPDELKHRVVILNHADLENPIPITSHDLIHLKKVDGIESEIANIETEIIMDSLKDKTNTIAIERFFKMALQLSYLVGDGNVLDAMRILQKSNYRNQLVKKINEDEYPLLIEEIEFFEEEADIETINNRLSRIKAVPPWIDCLSQPPVDGMDFWRWINGDENGAYLVLIYIPKRMNENFRYFLFAHYFVKLWKMVEAREIISKSKRKECLVVIDELHQLKKFRLVAPVIEAICKEARKYRARYLFTMHGWSSVSKETQDVIKDADPNLIMLKGGEDMFSSLANKFKPFDLSDFNALPKYTGLFKLQVNKSEHTFLAKLPQPEIRFHSSYTTEELKAMPNKYGRSKIEVRKMIREKTGKGGTSPCNNQTQMKKPASATEAFGSFTGARGYQKSPVT